MHYLLVVGGVCLAVIAALYLMLSRTLDACVPRGMWKEDATRLKIVFCIVKMLNIIAFAHSKATGKHILLSVRIVRERWFGGPKRSSSRSEADRSERPVRISKVSVAGLDALLFKPETAKASKMRTLLYIHGGGFSLGSAESYSPLLDRLAADTGCCVIGVNYRLLPENRLRDAFDDSFSAAEELLDSGSKIDSAIDESNIILGGDSAGANLALSVALKLRDKRPVDVHQLRAVALVYPFTSPLNYLLRSYIDKTAVPVLSTRHCLLGLFALAEQPYSERTLRALQCNAHVSLKLRQSAAWRYTKRYQAPIESAAPDPIVSEQWEAALSNAYAAPMLADTLKGLAKTIVLTAEHDVLRDDAFALVDRMRDEGVPVCHRNVNAFHGALMLFESTKSGNVLLNALVEEINAI